MPLAPLPLNRPNQFWPRLDFESIATEAQWHIKLVTSLERSGLVFGWNRLWNKRFYELHHSLATVWEDYRCGWWESSGKSLVLGLTVFPSCASSDRFPK